MGKKKRGKRNNDSNSTVIPHHRATGHGEQCDTILNSMPDEAESAEQYFNIDEFNSPTTSTTTTLSVGDTVKINGLVNASEYNGMRGVVVSELDATTNRCGVRITSKNTKVMAIQVTNLTLERRAKKSTTFEDTNVDIAVDSSMKVQSGSIREEIHDFEHIDSHNTKQVTRIMKDFRRCKKDAVKIVLSTLDAGECDLFQLPIRYYAGNCDSFRQGLIVNGLVSDYLISVTLEFLSQCEHEDFNEMVRKVKGNLRTPVDWIEILAHFGVLEQCKLNIAKGIQAVIGCLCDDAKRLFFKSNKYWNAAIPPFLTLVSNLLLPSSLVYLSVTVYNVLLQNEAFLDSIVQKAFWSSYRPDIVKEQESHRLSVNITSLQDCAHVVIRYLIVIGNKRDATELDNELNPSASQNGMHTIRTIAKTPLVSKAYDPDCKVNYFVGMIRMLKHVDSRESADQKDHFAALIMLTDCFDNDAIEEVIELGRKFATNIVDAMRISNISFCMLVRKVQGNVHPIDKRIAFAIKSGLFEMCFELLARFECDPSVRLIACDAKRDELIEYLVEIADIIRAVALHQNTSKAIRDRQSHIMQSLTPLVPQLKSEQSVQFVEILSSIMDLNEGSCSHCNEPIEWRTALFCGGCRRVAYCGEKCQKEDWRHGSHSSHCSFLARSADVFRLTTFEFKSSRNKSELTGLRNNIVTSQKKLFLRHEGSIFQFLSFPVQSDHIVLFNLSNKQQPIGLIHYHDQFTCSKQRAWFEDFRSSDKIICVFASGVFNGEFDEDGNLNIIHLAIFPIPKRIQSV
jgi:hypothetical protein